MSPLERCRDSLRRIFGDNKSVEIAIQIGLFTVAGAALLAVVLHAIWPKRFDSSSAMFLCIALAALVIREIQKFSFGNLTFERVQRIEAKLNAIENNVELPGRVEPVRPTAPPDEQEKSFGAVWSSDPNAGQFGGKDEVNKWRLSAIVTPIAGPDDAACEVRLRVASTDPARPLTGKVKFHLHPTFGAARIHMAEALRGVATHSFVSWGAFTVGAEVELDKTKLELDLSQVVGGTQKFKEQ